MSPAKSSPAPVERGRTGPVRTARRSLIHPADQVIHAEEVLAVADGHSKTLAAKLAGRTSGEAVAPLPARFNAQGLPALETRHGGGPPIRYSSVACERILREFRRAPDRRLDGTAAWSLVTLRRALRRAPDGLPKVSTDTVFCVVHEAGYSWQQDRTWFDTGKAIRVRKSGTVEVTDPDATGKNLIEQAYTLAEQEELPVRTQDEAGPYQTIPSPGYPWQKDGRTK